MLNSRWSQYLLVVATTIALTVTLWTSYNLNKKAQCLSAVSVQQQEVVRARAAIADGDRDSIRAALKGIRDARPFQSLDGRFEAGKAIDDYLDKQTELDELREKLPYPDPKKCD